MKDHYHLRMMSSQVSFIKVKILTDGCYLVLNIYLRKYF